MQGWILCGDAFIRADVIRWTEPDFAGPFGRNGRITTRGRPVSVGERQVVAEVVSDVDEKGFVQLLVRACEIVSVRTDVPVAPRALKPTSEIRRSIGKLIKGRIERLAWSDESARCSVVASRQSDMVATFPRFQ